MVWWLWCVCRIQPHRIPGAVGCLTFFLPGIDADGRLPGVKWKWVFWMALCLVAGGWDLSAWNYTGHRAVNLLALESLPADFPRFVHAAANRERIGFLAGEADRWRNTPDLPLRHVNGPDHFFDLEDLKPLGIDPERLTPFRYIYVEQVTRARDRDPKQFPPIPVEKNRDRTRQFVGFLPWTILEQYGKLKSAFSYLRAYEEAGTPEEVRQAQANVVYLMGLMGHFCADAAQPLHTTKHYNGWVGENPRGYTTKRSFHSWIDGGFFAAIGGIEEATIRRRLKPAVKRDTIRGRTDYLLPEIMNFIRAQHERVEPLYRLEKEGKLTGEPGRGREGEAFLNEQLLRGTQFLADLWYTAFRNAPDDKYLLGVLAKRKLKEKP